ncbi:MAG: hypothetical protein FJW39_17215 [Acidobacteria bacterium]|nr:hypothetical protein [Acidobacteriota bacterium]
MPRPIDGNDEILEAGSWALAFTALPAAPPPGLKQRLMARIAAPPRPGLGILRADEGSWEATGSPGVRYRKLYFDESTGFITMLVKMDPGAVYPSHLHTRAEQCLILEGDLRHPDNVFGTGDFIWGEAGSVDPAVSTVRGNLLLIVADPANEILA